VTQCYAAITQDRASPGSRFLAAPPQRIVNAMGWIFGRLSPGIGVRVGGGGENRRRRAWLPTECRSRSSRGQLKWHTSSLDPPYTILSL